MTENIFFFLKQKNDVRFFYESLSLREALKLMRAHGFSAVPVINRQGVYCGSVSEGDFMYFLFDHADEKDVLDIHLVKDLIRPDFMPAVSINVSFDELLHASLEQNYVPVVDDRKIFIGIVTRKAILNYLLEEKSKSEKSDTYLLEKLNQAIPPVLHSLID